MYRVFLQKSFLSFAALAAFFGYTEHVEAQSTPFKNDAEGMTLSPPSFEMTLEPGTETAYTIRITNPTKNLVELYPSAGNFSASGEGGEPKYEIGDKAIENDSRYSIASWIGFFDPKVAILPEQVVDFRFRIKVPQNAEPGGHYGVVFLGTKPPADKEQTSQVALSTMVGSLLLVRVPGDVRESLDVDEFSAPWFFFAPPVDFTFLLRNTGNVHARPMGDVVITDWRGHTRERLEINRMKGSVLPDSRREFNVSWNPDTSFFWNIPIGKFHANLKAVYGEEHHTLERSIAFWIIPWWIIITLGFFVLFLIIFITFFVIQKRRKKQMLQRNNSGFFPAFSQKAHFDSRKKPSENNHPRSIGRNWELETEDQESERSQKTLPLHQSKEIPFEETKPSIQQYNPASLQRIRESNEQSKQFWENQIPHSLPKNPQASPRSKKKRLV